ncbi:MAG TPA: lysophospholipid acyltransferase family protein [Pirellulaceae bacterium]|nr:lysophospholipid acyltransferase family protein [Pirellulaceae bacterium]HMO93131.1 lysophospholipid acyltransferase family protein [Pirellulaceae bacterium]HMP70310.1 lysophospholipid acyltransferase family protein [Pirellulaceae bacterium]
MKKVTVSILVGLAKFFSGATVRWVDCQPDTCQRIYFANHTSHVDALILWASLPRRIRNVTRPVAAKDYWDGGPIRRYIASVFNACLIDRNEVSRRNSPVDMLLQEMGDKFSLIIFPEGGRSPDGELGTFKSGLFYLGKKRPDLELVPVFLDNMNRVMPKGEVLPLPLLTSISIGAPIWLEPGEGKTEFLERARHSILKLKES